VLLSVIIILLTIAIIGASLVAFFYSVNVNTQKIVDEAKALYIAEGGIARAIYVLRNKAGAGTVLGEDIGPVTLGDGAYLVKIDFMQSLITSTGKVHGTAKTIQIQYSAL